MVVASVRRWHPMMGSTHACNGLAAGLAVGMLAPSPAISLACGAVGLATAGVPDTDHPQGSIPRLLGPFGFVVSGPVRAVSVLLTGVAHRGISHSLAAAVATGVLVGVAVLAWSGAVAVSAVLALAGFTGVVAALIGDAVTHAGLDHVFWPLPVRLRLPKWAAIRVGKNGERLLIWPASVVVTAAAAVGVVSVWT